MSPHELLTAATSIDWNPDVCVVCGKNAVMKGVWVADGEVTAIGWCLASDCQEDRRRMLGVLLLEGWPE